MEITLEQNTIKEKTIKKLNRQFVYRANTSDELMFRESDYDVIDFTDRDIFMDIGANCGANVVKYAHRVDSMICYECIPDSYYIMVSNAEVNNANNVIPQLAAISKTNGEMSIWINDRAKNRHSAASAIKKRGSTTEIRVPALSFYTEVKKYRPTIVKMDIEGAEFDVLNGIIESDLDGVRCFVLEVHLTLNKNAEEFIENLKAALPSFKCEQKDQPLLFGNKTCTLLFFTR